MKYLSQMLNFVERAATYRTTLASLFLLMAIDVAMLAASGQNVLTLKLASLEDSVGLGPILAVIVTFAVILCLAAPILWWLIDIALLWVRVICAENELLMCDHSSSWLASGYVKVDMLWDVAVREQSTFMRDIAASRKAEMAAAQERNRLFIHISLNTTVLLFVDLFAFGDTSITRTMWTYLGRDLSFLALVAAGLIATGRWLLAALKSLAGTEDEDQWVKYPVLAEKIREQRERRGRTVYQLTTPNEPRSGVDASFDENERTLS